MKYNQLGGYEMKKTYYRDSYGWTASLTENYDGTCTLRNCSPYGKRRRKDYNTVRGAKVALGKLSDCWTKQ